MILVLGQQRVEQHWNDAGPDRAPEQDRELDRIVKDDGDAVFRLHSEPCQRWAYPRHGIVQLRIADGARRIDERSLVAAAFSYVAVDEVDSDVVIAIDAHDACGPMRAKD